MVIIQKDMLNRSQEEVSVCRMGAGGVADSSALDIITLVWLQSPFSVAARI